MTNNDLLRRIRYIFDFNNKKMVALFALGDCVVTNEQLIDLLRKDDDSAMRPCPDIELARFLNGLIIENRGRKEGPRPVPEKRLTNNIVLRKLKIALDMKDQDIIDTLDLAELHLSKPELSAFFRKFGHKHYRECKDQVLRNFVKGLQIKHRGEPAKKTDFEWKTSATKTDGDS